MALCGKEKGCITSKEIKVEANYTVAVCKWRFSFRECYFQCEMMGLKNDLWLVFSWSLFLVIIYVTICLL